tara:strand:+ start:292 stop:540 length:249 start_codon:yes stop_codon:yes gene_type:complete
MSEEQLKAFLERTKTDISLQEKPKSAVDADAVVAIAKTAGFIISPEELKAKWEVSEKELEGVHGMGTNGLICTYNTGCWTGC